MALVAGCGGNVTTPQQTTAPSQQTTATSQTQETTLIDMDEEPYTVAIQVVVLPGTNHAGREDREAAINDITLPAINAKVQIQEVWISELRNSTSLAVAGGEKIDLVHVGTVMRLSSIVGADLLYDMNEDNLLNTRGQYLVDLFGEEILTSGLVGDRQLAVPANVFNAVGKGLYYNKTFADLHRIRVPEKMHFEDLIGILRQVKAVDNEMMPYYSGTGTLNYLNFLADFEIFGNLSSYGAILDVQNDPTVVNLFESDLYRDFAMMMQLFKAEGLQPGDPTDNNPAQSYFGAGKLFSVVSDVSESIKSSTQNNAPNFEVGWITLVEPVITNGTATQFMWGIASNSERPDKAMDFLNYMYENADVANILTYGLKDVTYEFVNGSQSVVKRLGTYNPAFFRGGNAENMFILTPNGEDFVANMKATEASAAVSPLLGYIFNDSAFQTESSVINSIITEYIPRINSGMADSPATMQALLDEFNAKLKLGGIEDVIEANQEQINDYLSKQG